MNQKYPWETWFGRSRTVLLRGVHYKCSQSAMCQLIRNNASKRGMRVRLTDTGTEIVMEIGASDGEVPRTDPVAVTV